MPWCKLKRWMDVYLKRRRREWKQQLALTTLGARSQMQGLVGGDEGGAYEAMSDTDRVGALAGAGFPVVTRRVE